MHHHDPTIIAPAIVRTFYDRIWNAGALDAANDLLATDFAFRGSPGPETYGRTAFCDYVRSVRTALANYRCDILDCVTEGEKVFAKMRFSGTHVGVFRGFQPSGKTVQWLGAALFRTQAHRIVQLWVLGDLAALDETLRKNAAD